MKKFFNETLQNVKPNRQVGLEPEHIKAAQQEFDTVKNHINLFIGDEFIFNKDRCINIEEYPDKPWLTFGPSKKFNPGDSVILKQFKSSSPSNLKDLRYNIIVSSDDGQQELLQLKNWDHKDVLGPSAYFRDIYSENINVTIGGLRKIIKEELDKIIQENEDNSNAERDVDQHYFEGSYVEIDEDRYLRPYTVDLDWNTPSSKEKFGPTRRFKPGDTVRLGKFSERNGGEWIVYLMPYQRNGFWPGDPKWNLPDEKYQAEVLMFAPDLTPEEEEQEKKNRKISAREETWVHNGYYDE